MSGLPLVLVIDDEFLLLADVEDVLAKSGFATESFFSGEEALACFLENTKSYLAFTDVRLGGDMDGWAVAKGIREKEPGFPIIYMTGATEEDWGTQGVRDSMLVRKPFKSAHIVNALSTLLSLEK